MLQHLVRYIKPITPPLIWSAMKHVGSLVHRPKPGEPISEAEEDYRQRSNGLPANRISLRRNLEFSLHPSSRNAFEHFCFISAEMVEEMDRFLELSSSKTRFVDIGALHGVFTLAFMLSGQEERQSLAIDASPVAFARLLYNLHANNLERAAPIECAASDREGVLEMHYEWQHAVAAPSADLSEMNSSNMLRIPCSTGDAICSEKAFQPDIIKIDVEGHECHVLRGLEATLQTHRPLLFLEIHPERIRAEGESLTELAAFLDGLGYEAETMDQRSFPLGQLDGLTSDVRLVLNAGPSNQNEVRT